MRSVLHEHREPGRDPSRHVHPGGDTPHGHISARWTVASWQLALMPSCGDMDCFDPGHQPDPAEVRRATALVRVAEAAAACRHADDARLEAIRAAADAGASQVKIGEAAGFSRQWIRKLLKET